MDSGDSYYSSISDRCWFPGNPAFHEKIRFTWYIHKSGFYVTSGYWKMSVSDAGPVYFLSGNSTSSRTLRKKILLPTFYNNNST
jgi:hypothetical protein